MIVLLLFKDRYENTSFLGMFSFKKKKNCLSWKAIGGEFKLKRIQIINLYADFHTSPYKRGIDGNVPHPYVEMFFQMLKRYVILKNCTISICINLSFKIIYIEQNGKSQLQHIE